MSKSFIQELKEEKEKLLKELEDLAKVNVPYDNPHCKYLRQRVDLLNEMIASYYKQSRKEKYYE